MKCTPRLFQLIFVALYCELNWSFTLGGMSSPTVTFSDRLPQTYTHRKTKSRRQLSSSKSFPEASTTTKVLYQKVIRPSNNLPDLLFLGYLVEYLESHFQIPTNLPMIYESLPGNEKTRCILAWDSPLSPSPEATRMEVEVVGIYTDRKEEASSSMPSSQPSAPQLAMVVVRKAKSSTLSLPPMMINLFRDSEKKILNSLDRGLEDFVAGRIKFQPDKVTTKKIPKNVKTIEEAIEVELMDSIPQRKTPKVEAKDVVFEAYATEDRQTARPTKMDEKKKGTPSPEKVAAAVATMKVKANPPDKTKSMTNDYEKLSSMNDYAVEAAKQKVKTKNNIPKKLEDYAIAAARRIEERKAKAKTPDDFSVEVAKNVVASGNASSTKQQKANVDRGHESPPKTSTPDEEFRIPDYMGQERAFRTTISRPKDRREGNKQDMERRPESKRSMEKPSLIVNSLKFSESERNNGFVKQESKNSQTAVLDQKWTQRTNATPSREQMEMDIINAAKDVMDDMANQGVDMTPEDLLRDVLKFGEEIEKEEAIGNGFVSAAFDKAKELLRQQHQQRQAKINQQVGYQDRSMVDKISFAPSTTRVDQEDLSAEEELRRMFAAGERIAEGRITHSEQETEDLAFKVTSEEDIDTLIARERTISKYARSLENELAELELTINASPGEELDGPRQNPIFDVFSGPEVYNPNVELDTVNYPGAIPGTKAMQLPKELNEAIRQAEFAVEVLAGLTTIENVSEDGQQEVKYFSGKRELTEKQVQKLETVAGEAMEIGLIRDPIRLVDESSRLQLLLDELWRQPDERFRNIADSYKDLLLSDNFIDLIKARLRKMADRDLEALRQNNESLKEPHERERRILGQLVVYAQLLLKETRALGAELEAQQLEVIRSICQVAMDPKHQTEEETAIALSDAVRDIRPLLDDSFVAYLKYAVAEEEARLARAGLVDDPEHNQWLFVLKIVQQGVYAEISKSINRYIEHIWYVMRMETPKQRKMLLARLIDDMPTLDVRPFVRVVENIVGALGDATRGEFDGAVPLGEMTNKLLQLRRNVKELLPPERIAEKSRDADEWAARQKERLKEARKVGKQRLKAASDVAGRQSEIDDVVGRKGEVERFT